MRKQQLWTGIGASLGMFILILDGKTAIAGAQDGINLCIRSVIPSLFPYFLLSVLLTGAFPGINLPILRPIGKLFSLPEGTESLLICAFLGGYPSGAQCVGQAYRAGQLSKKDAQRLLAFCSNAGPAFLFGMAGRMFPDPWIPWGLWFLHIFSAYLVSLFFSGSDHTGKLEARNVVSVSDAMYSAVKTMALVCGWVILFRVVTSFLNRWLLWAFPTEIQVIISGLLELSNGCCSLSLIEDVRIRFLVCSGILAFGGLCVTMQTVSVTKGLSTKYYLAGKLLQTLFSLILGTTVIWRKWGMILPFATVFCFVLHKIRKNSSNPLLVGV